MLRIAHTRCLIPALRYTPKLVFTRLYASQSHRDSDGEDFGDLDFRVNVREMEGKAKKKRQILAEAEAKKQKKAVVDAGEVKGLDAVRRKIDASIPATITHVKLLDENNTYVGDMKREEAQQLAKSKKLNLILENERQSPPLCRLGNYQVRVNILLMYDRNISWKNEADYVTSKKKRKQMNVREKRAKKCIFLITSKLTI